MPAVQLEHTEADINEYFPAGQTPDTTERPDTAQKLPDGHVTEADIPIVEQNVPEPQLTHELEAVFTEYDPALHFKQVEEDVEPVDLR